MSLKTHVQCRLIIHVWIAVPVGWLWTSAYKGEVYYFQDPAFARKVKQKWRWLWIELNYHPIKYTFAVC